jgi:hypothetical protein
MFDKVIDWLKQQKDIVERRAQEINDSTYNGQARSVLDTIPSNENSYPPNRTKDDPYTTLMYPPQLGSPGYEHMVVFFINDSTVNTTDKVQSFKTADWIPKVKNAESSEKIAQQMSQYNLHSLGDATDTKLFRDTKRMSTAIALYMPGAINTSYPFSWENEDLGFAGDAVQTIANGGSITDKMRSLLGSAVVDALNKAGKDGTPAKAGINLGGTASLVKRFAYNPHSEVLFKGVKFRSFSFNYGFSPRSKDEVKIIRNIIRTFTLYGSPDVNLSVAGKLFTYPAEFDIIFYSYGKENNVVNKISTCALTGIDVSWGNGGSFSAFHRYEEINGAPTQIGLSLKFTELELITRQRVKEGY